MSIRIDKITKKYKRNTREEVVLKDFEYDIPEGKFTVFHGESGVGKSTLLRIVSGLTKPTEGKVYFGDVEITALNDIDISEFRKSHLGIMTQNIELIPYLSVIDNLKFVYGLNNDLKKVAEVDEEKIEELLNELGLHELRNEFPSSLSSGELKRAAIARTLINSPKYIIMDEPTANLDHKNVVKVLKLLCKYAENGSTVIISSHEEEALEYADNHKKLEFIKQ